MTGSDSDRRVAGKAATGALSTCCRAAGCGRPRPVPGTGGSGRIWPGSTAAPSRRPACPTLRHACADRRRSRPPRPSAEGCGSRRCRSDVGAAPCQACSSARPVSAPRRRCSWWQALGRSRIRRRDRRRRRGSLWAKDCCCELNSLICSPESSFSSEDRCDRSSRSSALLRLRALM